MTLYTNDYLEYYLTLVGWIIGNGIWDVLVASGIVALPIVVMVTQEWLPCHFCSPLIAQNCSSSPGKSPAT